MTRSNESRDFHFGNFVCQNVLVAIIKILKTLNQKFSEKTDLEVSNNQETCLRQGLFLVDLGENVNRKRPLYWHTGATANSKAVTFTNKPRFVILIAILSFGRDKSYVLTPRRLGKKPPRNIHVSAKSLSISDSHQNWRKFECNSLITSNIQNPTRLCFVLSSLLRASV